MADLDENLLLQARRVTTPTGLTIAECVAIALLRRRGVKAPVLKMVFNVSRQTIYYRSINAIEAERLIERIGAEAAWADYVTPEILAKVDRANAQEAKKAHGYWTRRIARHEASQRTAKASAKFR